ncbi:uncharacterized protein LOC127729103 [Mytilus californianus]|uniref:uncharacterized protein LOC127729103 n=1 Tax=Mytilus californianus TaxID=6549 RepID=UPI002246F409|nr:uncharacterized protein LOC127729103 [Mytilus californianus]
MQQLMLFRVSVLVLLIVGFILCFLSLVLPYWIMFNMASVSGYQGLFFTCIYNHGGDVPCSSIMDSNVYGSYKISQVFMGLGFSLYFISVVLASMTFFWTRDLKKIRVIKFAAASFAFLTAICLIVAVVVFNNTRDKETETITTGWYIAVVSLGFVTFACPCYIVDGCHTIKQKDEKASTANIAPCPTALTVYQRQQLIDGFNNQMSKQQSQLPEPLGLKGKFSVLYVGTNIEHPPPKPIIPVDSDDDTNKSMKMEPLKQPMVIPPSSEYTFKTIYDDDDNKDKFVHPPPKIVSSDTPLKDILFRNLQTYSGYDSDVSRKSSCYSLESGQIDDSDLEIYLLTKGSRSNRGSEEDRPPSREAFGKKKIKKKHKVTSQIVDGKNVTEIAHEGLPTINIIGPDRESSDYKGSIPLHGSSSTRPREEEILLPSEAENDDDTDYKANNKTTSKRSSRRHQPEHGNEAYAKSDDEIYTAKYGASSPYTEKKDVDNEKGGYDDKRQKPRKPSSKRKKQNRSGTKHMEGDSSMSLKDLNTTKGEIPNEATGQGAVGYCIGGEVCTGLPKENTTSSDQAVGKDNKKLSSKRKHKSKNKHGEKFEELAIEKEKYGQHDDGDKTHRYDDDEEKKNIGNEKNDKNRRTRHSSKKKHTKPYVGTKLTYDKVETDLDKGDCDPTAQIQQDETSAIVEQILKIPLNVENDDTKL